MATQTAKGPCPPWGNCSSSPCLTLLPQVDFREMRGPYGFRQSGGQARIKSVNTSGDRPVQTLSAVTTSTGPGSCSKKVRGKKTNTYVRVSSHIALLLVAKLLPDGSARPPEQNRISRHERASSTHDVRREVVREKRILHFTTDLCVGRERFFCREQRFANPLPAALPP